MPLTVNVSIYMSIANREEMAVVVSAGEWLEWDNKAIGPGSAAPEYGESGGCTRCHTFIGCPLARSPVGRLVTNFVLNSDNRFGSVTAGGFRRHEYHHIFRGDPLGEPERRDPKNGYPIMSVQDFGDWMEENEARLGENSNEVGYDLRLSALIASNGPSTAPLACTSRRSGLRRRSCLNNGITK